MVIEPAVAGRKWTRIKNDIRLRGLGGKSEKQCENQKQANALHAPFLAK
ncbi:hypothetical protein [Pseudodesulfovibrio cashew]|nr:hypothetical protein [Pseudodesulfovibrio cashew]